MTQALCDGHFPGDPLLPGATLAGLMAEMGTLLLGRRGSPAARLVRVERCVFRARAIPSEPIEIVARLSAPWRVDAAVEANGRPAAAAALRFAVRP